MPELSTIQDLIPLLGSVVTEPDPITALERNGHAVSSALKQSLRRRQSPTDAQRALWNDSVRRAGAVQFSVGQQPRLTSRDLLPGEYEFTAGLRISTANEILVGLFANGTIPGVFYLDELLSTTQRDLLAGAFVVDQPGGALGSLVISAAPTISVLQDGTNRVGVTIPFRLNFERIRLTHIGMLRTVVTYASGGFTVSVGLVADLETVTIREHALEIQIDLSDSDGASLRTDAGSPVQRTNPPLPGEVDGIAVILQNAIRQRLADSLRWTISPRIPLPFGGSEVRDAVMRVRGDAVLVGVKAQGIPGSGDPDTLTPMFDSADTNLFSRVHDSVLKLLLRRAAASGQLTALARETHPDAVIDSADVHFGDGTVAFQARGKIVDACPLGVDVGFTVTQTITLTFQGTRIRIDKETSTDLDNGDVALCTLTSLSLALFAAIAAFVFQNFWAAIAAFGEVGALALMLEYDGDDLDLILSGGGDDGPTFIELDKPVPATDLLPTLDGTLVLLDDSTMLMSAHVGLRPDPINTYFYMRFVDADAISFGSGHPIRDAVVELMDRDSPAPPGDDVVFPAPTRRQSSHGNVRTTVRTFYERSGDELLARGKTDSAGFVRLYVSKDDLQTKGGSKVVETTRLNVDTDQQTTSRVRTPFPEQAPDLYFRITRADGTSVDTLQLPGGFFLNVQHAQVGTPQRPLTVTFGGDGPPVVVMG